MYEVTLKILGKEYKAEANDIVQAFSGLKVGKVAGRVLLTVSKDGVEKSRILNAIVTDRALNGHGLTQEVAQKQIASMFQGL